MTGDFSCGADAQAGYAPSCSSSPTKSRSVASEQQHHRFETVERPLPVYSPMAEADLPPNLMHEFTAPAAMPYRAGERVGRKPELKGLLGYYDEEGMTDPSPQAARHIHCKFASDLPLEEGVCCELVSESETSGVLIPVRFWAILVS